MREDRDAVPVFRVLLLLATVYSHAHADSDSLAEKAFMGNEDALLSLTSAAPTSSPTNEELGAFFGGQDSSDYSADPAAWTGLCATGRQQSPVNIQTSAVLSVDRKVPLSPAFIESSGLSCSNDDGRAVVVEGDSLSDDITTFNYEEYHLKQIRFQRRSESTIDGRHFPLEAQLLHQRHDGKKLVVSVLFVTGEQNKAVTLLDWHSLAPSESRALPAFDPSGLMPDRLGYFWYNGSLPYPPCTEGVHWVVLRSHPSVSSTQLAAFPIKKNANQRPVQPLHQREISRDSPVLPEATVEAAFLGDPSAAAKVKQQVNKKAVAAAKAARAESAFLGAEERQLNAPVSLTLDDGHEDAHFETLLQLRESLQAEQDEIAHRLSSEAARFF